MERSTNNMKFQLDETDETDETMAIATIPTRAVRASEPGMRTLDKS
jgi:hypothetical protein